MNEVINLSPSFPIYKEYNNLIYDYFHKKLNEKETLEEIMSKIHPKFKTPIKYKKNSIVTKSEDRQIKCYKRPIYYIMNKSWIIKNPFFDERYNKKIPNIRKINNLDNNELTRDNSFDNILRKNSIDIDTTNKQIYYKTPIKDRKKYNKKGIQNFSCVNTNESSPNINKSEHNIYKIKKITEKKINKKKKNHYAKNICEFKALKSNKKRNVQQRDIYNKNLAKSYDNIVFKKKINIIKKKKRAKIIRQKTYDNINNNAEAQKKIKKIKTPKVNMINPIKKYKAKYEINKLILIQKWWKSINQKRIENFNKKFNKYRLNKKEKKYNISSNLNHGTIYFAENQEKVDKIKIENNISIINKIRKIAGTWHITKNRYMKLNSKIILLQREIKEYLYKKNNIVKKPLYKKLFISKTKETKTRVNKNPKYKIEHNFIYEIFPSTIKDNLNLNGSFSNNEINETSKIKNNLSSKNVICKIENINYIKNIVLKPPLIKDLEYISREIQYKKEYITKNIKYKNRRNIIEDCSKSYSTIDNTIIKTKISLNEEQNEINTCLKNKHNNFMQKEHLNKLNEFILYIIQRINKNINQFVFYAIK